MHTNSFNSPWMPYAMLLGLVFVSGFNTSALTVKYFGVTISQIMQRMSILLTVPFAVLVYRESSGGAKILGFVLAMLAIVLVNWPKPKEQDKIQEAGHRLNLFWIPFATWILAGVIEMVFLKVKYENLTNLEDPSFIISVFGTAGFLGLLVAIWGYANKRMEFAWKNIFGGFVLGVPNYGSMLFMLWALNGGLEGSFVFPMVNISIIVSTTIGAVLLFQEKLSKMNWVGIALSIASIILISLP
ncbi:MAG: EamA family transporter [Lewinellaceae bacterium]|nr:EamA family transporter [Saprospiraceae bacterium]MCB9343923.1 EamA family transporter [Lewinellaceae bacterium]